MYFITSVESAIIRTMLTDSSETNHIPASSDNYLKSKIIAGCCIVIIALSAGVAYSFGILLVPLQGEFGWDRDTVSAIFAIFLAVAAVSAPIAIRLSGILGPRIVALIMGIVAGLGLFLTSLADSSWHIYCAYGVVAASGIGSICAVATFTIGNWFSREQALLFGITGAGIGVIFLAPLSGWIVSSYDWTDAFLALAITAWVISIPLAFFVKNPNKETGLTPDESRAPCLEFTQVVKLRNFWITLGMWFFLSFAFHVAVIHFIPNALDFGVTIGRASFLLSILGGVAVISALISSSLSDMADRKTFAIAFALVASIAMFWVVEADEMWRYCVCSILLAPALGGIYVCVLPLNSKMLVGPTVSGRTLSAGTVWIAGGVLGAYFGGYFFDSIGDYRFTFFIGACGMFIAAMFCWNMQTSKPKAKEPQLGAEDDGTDTELR